MRLDRDDSYVSRMRESLPISVPSLNNRPKLISSVMVLGLALLFAAVRQFAAREPIATSVATSVATERTVFGDPRPSPANPERETITPEPHTRQPLVEQGTRARTITPQPATRRAILSANIPGDLHAFLDRWRSTLISGDASAQADLYAAKVDRFFTKRNVSRIEVRREKERLLAQYPEFQRYEIGDVRVESMDGNRAVVTFRKDWDARGRGRFAGSERQRLTLTRESGSWKIVGEEETKVYWVRRT